MKAQELYLAGIVMAATLLSSTLTWIGTVSTYQSASREEKVATMIVHKKLQECAVDFGTYIASKGKYGREYFEKHY